MGNYVPTTEDVRRAYREHCRDYDAIDGLATSPESYEEEFNRWLAQVKAEAQVAALRDASMEFYRDGEGEWDGFGVSHALTLDADRIAREAGIEAGASND